MADHLHSPELGAITHEGLREAYQHLHDTLARFELRATAAFVTAFAAGPVRLMAHQEVLDALLRINPAWFGELVPLLKSGQTSGWDGQWCFELMRRGGHEMAWHGTTHQTLDNDMSSEAFELEMHLTRQLHAALSHQPASIVFPRNVVGQLDRLRSAGFATYRDQMQVKGLSGRVQAKLAEFNPLAPRPDPQPLVLQGWHVVAPGQFLHWPCGHRALVPAGLTIARWKGMLDRAVREGGVVHMWFHPHNLLTAPAMRHTLREILAHVAMHVRAGRMRNLTMAGLCQLERG
ncbi:MAG: hypothetical protein RLZZ271_1435 [Pseudomonadota bacterium]